MEREKVTVIIFCYNQEDFIAKAIKSVTEQTYSNLEILISDNGSKDNSKRIISEFAALDSRIKFFDYEENLPLSVRQNTLSKLSKGDFISLLYADDYYLEDKIKTQVDIFQGLNDDWGVVHGPGLRLFLDTGLSEVESTTKAHGDCLKELFNKFSDGFINPIAPLIRRNCYLENPSHESLWSEGENLFFRFAIKYKFYYLEKPLVVMVDHENNLGKNLIGNLNLHNLSMDQLRENKEFPSKYLNDLNKHHSEHMSGVAIECIRSDLDYNYGKNKLLEAVRIYPRSLFKLRIIITLTFLSLPVKMQILFLKLYRKHTGYKSTFISTDIY